MLYFLAQTVVNMSSRNVGAQFIGASVITCQGLENDERKRYTPLAILHRIVSTYIKPRWMKIMNWSSVILENEIFQNIFIMVILIICSKPANGESLGLFQILLEV